MEITKEIRDLFLNSGLFCEECREKFGDDYRESLTDKILTEEIDEAIKSFDSERRFFDYFPNGEMRDGVWIDDCAPDYEGRIIVHTNDGHVSGDYDTLQGAFEDLFENL